MKTKLFHHEESVETINSFLEDKELGDIFTVGSYVVINYELNKGAENE